MDDGVRIQITGRARGVPFDGDMTGFAGRHRALESAPHPGLRHIDALDRERRRPGVVDREGVRKAPAVLHRAEVVANLGHHGFRDISGNRRLREPGRLRQHEGENADRAREARPMRRMAFSHRSAHSPALSIGPSSERAQTAGGHPAVAI